MNVSTFLTKVLSIFIYFVQSNLFSIVFLPLICLAIIFATVRIMRYIFGLEN